MTRIDHVLLEGALASAEADLHRLTRVSLAPYLVVLAKDNRQHLVRPREGFVPAARILLHEAHSQPALAAAAGLDAAAVAESLDNADSLATVILATAELLRRLDDSRLTWLADAFGPTVRLYRMAKVRAEDDGHLREVVAPMVDLFASPPRKDEEPATEPTTATAATAKVEGA